MCDMFQHYYYLLSHFIFTPILFSYSTKKRGYGSQLTPHSPVVFAGIEGANLSAYESTFYPYDYGISPIIGRLRTTSFFSVFLFLLCITTWHPNSPCDAVVAVDIWLRYKRLNTTNLLQKIQKKKIK